MDLVKWKKEWLSLTKEDQRNDFEIRFRKAIRELSDKEKIEASAEFLKMAKIDLDKAKEIIAENRELVAHSA